MNAIVKPVRDSSHAVTLPLSGHERLGLAVDRAVLEASQRFSDGGNVRTAAAPDTAGIAGGVTLATLASYRVGGDVPQLIQASIENWAADFFSGGAVAWAAAPADATPWVSYRAVASTDRTPEWLGLRDVRAAFAALPDNATAVLITAAAQLGWPRDRLADHFYPLLLEMGALTRRASAIGWTRERRGEDAAAPRQMLALRASWELVLFQSLGLGSQRPRPEEISWYA